MNVIASIIHFKGNLHHSRNLPSDLKILCSLTTENLLQSFR